MFSKFRITIYKGDTTTTPSNRWGISEIFYCFPEAYRLNSGLHVFSSDQLATTRKLAVNLANTSTDSTFDGSADQTGIKVSGKLADANIASAATWNAKQDALTEITDQEVTDLLDSLT